MDKREAVKEWSLEQALAIKLAHGSFSTIEDVLEGAKKIEVYINGQAIYPEQEK